VDGGSPGRGALAPGFDSAKRTRVPHRRASMLEEGLWTIRFRFWFCFPPSPWAE
jgi:hypothetical protein